MIQKHFECLFCNDKFINETRYLNHHCRAMARAEELKTAIGQAGFLLYQKWMRLQKRMIPTIEQFANSKFYVSLIKFAHFVRKHQIPDVDLYIRLMIEKQIPPSWWTFDEAYREYLEFLEKRATPDQQTDITISTLNKIAKAAQCEVKDVFQFVKHGEVIELLKQRRLSPWVLLCSPKFGAFLKTCTAEQRTLYDAIIKPGFWIARFNKHKEDADKVKEKVAELGL